MSPSTSSLLEIATLIGVVVNVFAAAYLLYVARHGQKKADDNIAGAKRD